jgi:hypothetical protein
MTLLSFKEIQKAIIDALKADAGISGIVGSRVYNHPPQSTEADITAKYPYIVVAILSSAPFDTKNSYGEDATLSVDCYSNYHADIECHDINDAVIAKLHAQPLSLSAGQMICLERDLRTVFTEADGQTRHGLARFRLLLDAGDSAGGIPTP